MRTVARIAVGLAVLVILGVTASLVVVRTPKREGCGGLREWIEAELAGDWSGHDGEDAALLSLGGSDGVLAWSADGIIEACDVTVHEVHLWGAELRLAGSTMGNLVLLARFNDDWSMLPLSGQRGFSPWRSGLALERGSGDRPSFRQLRDAMRSHAPDRAAASSGR